MNRRVFSQLLAFGAGLFTASRAGASERPQDDESAGGPSDGLDDQCQPTVTRETIRKVPVTDAVTVDDFIPRAQATLPKATFEYITSGSEDEVTLRDNVAAFRRLRVLPPLLHGVSKVDLSTTVLGQRVSMPILLAPVAGLRLFHQDGGMGSARAADSMGTIAVSSSSVGNSVEELAGSTKAPKWFQMYVPRERDVARRLVKRIEKAGFKAIVVTVDLGERKDADLRNKFSLPRDMLLKHLRDIGYTQLRNDISNADLQAFNVAAWDISLSTEFFKWLRKETRLPILLKGVLSKQAALQAVELGLNGVVVSNHGGRRMDGMPASIDQLTEVSATLKGSGLEILFDSGVRRGGDVLKALALGAKAVLIGRPQAWALASDGEAGVRRVLEILRDELTGAMLSSGCRNVQEINRSLIMNPQV
ncbi:MAG: alpha-hydroxy acid oxidase [Planctomycetota bacterium]|nr:alpha-hydroxy acid oxidase [Planctomycetota bacterium]